MKMFPWSSFSLFALVLGGYLLFIFIDGFAKGWNFNLADGSIATASAAAAIHEAEHAAYDMACAKVTGALTRCNNTEAVCYLAAGEGAPALSCMPKGAH